MWELLRRFRALDSVARRMFFRVAVLLPAISLSLKMRGFRATQQALQHFSISPEEFGNLMSGFAGIVSLDGAPPDALLLQRMAERLAFRGPDGTHITTKPGAGFCFTFLRTVRRRSVRRSLAPSTDVSGCSATC